MGGNAGAHDSKRIETGELVHLIKHPGTKWFVNSYEWSNLSDDGKMFWTARVTFQMVGWDKLEFNTTDDAYSFVQEQINNRKVPSMEHH